MNDYFFSKFLPALILLLVLCAINSVYSQTNTAAKLDSLQYIDDMPYICRGQPGQNHGLAVGCGSKLYWQVVMLKDNAIPFLINKLDDSTSTAAIVPNFGYPYTVADIAYTALNEIIHDLPTFELLGNEFEELGCRNCNYWQHLNADYKNRLAFKMAVQQWYSEHKNQLVWVESNRFSSCDCAGMHPNGGHYQLSVP